MTTVRLTTASTPLDPYALAVAAPGLRWLHHLNPLAKLAAPLLPILLLLFVRDIATPVAFLAVAYAVLLTGARMTRLLAVLLFAALPLGIIVVGLGLSLWVDPAKIDPGSVVLQLGEWHLFSGALLTGLATALRLGAIVALSFIGGVTTTGPDLVRAAVEHLRLPYRIGYTALAAYRFIPRFRHELEVIRAAHRVRGRHAGRGPIAAVARGWGYVLPLMAGAIRHAERVALAMDSRAFGAYDTRTERRFIPWRTRDTVFIAAFLAVSAAIFWVLFPWGL